MALTSRLLVSGVCVTMGLVWGFSGGGSRSVHGERTGNNVYTVVFLVLVVV